MTVQDTGCTVKLHEVKLRTTRDNLKIKGKVPKLLQRSLAHENLKMQLSIHEVGWQKRHRISKICFVSSHSYLFYRGIIKDVKRTYTHTYTRKLINTRKGCLFLKKKKFASDICTLNQPRLRSILCPWELEEGTQTGSQ